MSFFSFGKKTNTPKVPWVKLVDINDIDRLLNDSNEKPIMFFKHSTRCSISAMALNRLENSWQFTDDQIVPVYLDLIAYRSISNELADRLHVMHQSPQVLLVKDGHCTYHASHNQIDTRSIKSNL